VRLWCSVALISVVACVTESLYVCVNCNVFRVTDLRGGFTVVLTASAGEMSPCQELQTQMETPITWRGCLEPQGGRADSLAGFIRLDFEDSTGVKGAIEFFDVEGGADSANAMWRISCLKDAPPGSCPLGSGTARWFRTPG